MSEAGGQEAKGVCSREWCWAEKSLVLGFNVRYHLNLQSDHIHPSSQQQAKASLQNRCHCQQQDDRSGQHSWGGLNALQFKVIWGLKKVNATTMPSLKHTVENIEVKHKQPIKDKQQHGLYYAAAAENPSKCTAFNILYSYLKTQQEGIWWLCEPRYNQEVEELTVKAGHKGVTKLAHWLTL